MTGDPARDDHATPHDFAAPDVPWDDNDYRAARDQREAEARLQDCPDCGHSHSGREWGYICIGCPCEVRPEAEEEGEGG